MAGGACAAPASSLGPGSPDPHRLPPRTPESGPPSPFSLRPGGPDAWPLPAQSRRSRPPAPTPSDPGVWTPRRSSPTQDCSPRRMPSQHPVLQLHVKKGAGLGQVGVGPGPEPLRLAAVASPLRPLSAHQWGISPSLPHPTPRDWPSSGNICGTDGQGRKVTEAGHRRAQTPPPQRRHPRAGGGGGVAPAGSSAPARGRHAGRRVSPPLRGSLRGHPSLIL